VSHADPPLPPAVFLMGPTGSGKTDLAVDLVERLPLEIISVDSVMVYRGMDIGSAKPDAEILATAPHRLIDICDPAEPYSAARFRADALREMGEVARAGRVPLLVGGTMLYFRALERGIAEMPGADPGVRARLVEAASRDGLATLHRRLAEIDPEAAARIHQNDPQRIFRGLEVFELTGRPLSSWQRSAGRAAFPYRALKLIRAPAERAVLRARIAERFSRMLACGFEDEVRRLLARGDLTPDLPSMRAVGYRQMAEYLGGTGDRDLMIDKAVDATRQLAKRQLTWLRRESDAVWVGDGQAERDRALALIEAFIRPRASQLGA